MLLHSVGASGLYVGHVPRGQTDKFSDYVVWALRKMKDRGDDITDKIQQKTEEELDEYYHEMFDPDEENIIRKVASYWCLRAVLSPLIEVIITLDRYLYLTEHGHSVFLRRIFDKEMSPRSLVLIACKDSKNLPCTHHKDESKMQESK